MIIAETAPAPVVLVAEDDMAMRELYRAVLGRCGLSVIETGSGCDVVPLARCHGPRVVLLDSQLPGMHGSAVLQALKADAHLKNIPVIAATGLSGDSPDVWLDAGFADVLFKPVGLADLRPAVLRHIR